MSNSSFGLVCKRIQARNELSFVSTSLLLCSLIILLVAPSFLMAIGLASSQALGTSLSGVLIIAMGFLARGRLDTIRQTSRWLPFALAAVAVHLLVACLFDNVAIGRGVVSLCVLTLFVLAAATLAELLLRLSTVNFFRILDGVCKLLLLIGVWGCVGLLQPFGSIYPKAVFPFNEPSHFALLLTPFLIGACAVTSPVRRVIYIGCALVETALLENLTMAVGCVLAAITCLPIRYLAIVPVVALPIVGVLDIDYYSDRFGFLNGETTNLSALVYLQGWQMLFEAFERTLGVGVGFQQLGVNGSEVDAAVIIQNLIGDDQNLLDGGMTTSKLISEFGIFGIIFIYTYLGVALKAVVMLRSSIRNPYSTPPIILLSAGIIVSYLLELFVRGAGYFTPGGLLALTALLLWFRASNQVKSP